nr:AP2/B3 transcription factor family protein [Tanacetum cinerariifolium]
NLLGEDLGPLNCKELEFLEKQLDTSLKHIRSARYIVPKEEEASLKLGLGTQIKYIVPKEEEASLKLGLGTQVKYIVPEEEEGSVEGHEMKDEVIQASNVETKGVKLFGVQIA